MSSLAEATREEGAHELAHRMVGYIKSDQYISDWLLAERGYRITPNVIARIRKDRAAAEERASKTRERMAPDSTAAWQRGSRVGADPMKLALEAYGRRA